MKTLAALSAILIVLAVGDGNAQNGNPCFAAGAKGFVAIQHEPQFLVGTIPSRFTDKAVYFVRRFNCTGRSAQVRRVDLGLYEIKFPGLKGELAVTSAVSDEGVSASAHTLGDGIIRVALRGPLVNGNVESRRDVAFSVVVF